MKCSDDREEDKWSFSINLETSAECFSRGLKIIPHPRRSTRRTLEKGGDSSKQEDGDWTNLLEKPIRFFTASQAAKAKVLPSVTTLASDQAAMHCSVEQNSCQSQTAVHCKSNLQKIKTWVVFLLVSFKWKDPPAPTRPTGSDKTVNAVAFLSLPIAAVAAFPAAKQHNSLTALVKFSFVLLRNLKSAHWHELDCPSRLCKSWYLNDCCIFIFCALFSARHARLMNHTASGVRRFPHLSWTLHLLSIMRAAVCANIHRQNKYYALGILSNIKKKKVYHKEDVGQFCCLFLVMHKNWDFCDLLIHKDLSRESGSDKHRGGSKET